MLKNALTGFPEKNMLSKADFRAQLRRTPISEEGAAKLREFLYALECWINAESVFIYVSVYPEIDTREIIKEAFRLKKHVAVPKIVKKGIMQARGILSLNDLVPGVYGIPEPPKGAPEMLRPDLCVVPCLACDRHGVRLGHGGGYYDEYLSRVRYKSVCLCPASAVFDALPFEKHDVKPDIILTENGVLETV